MSDANSIPAGGLRAPKSSTRSARGRKSASSRSRPPVPKPDAIYDPVARTLDFIGDRWSLVLVRLLLLGPKGFQELRQRTGIAPRVLSSRLKQMVEQGFVEGVVDGYRITERGRTLEPIVAEITRWFTRHGFAALSVDASQFTESSPQAIMETLPFLLDAERAAEVQVTFEIRLTGEGGGVWVVNIDHGACTVEAGFADRADVRYTAEAKTWCGMALGMVDARELVRRGLVTKDGSDHAMDHYFRQISHPGGTTQDLDALLDSERKGEQK